MDLFYCCNESRYLDNTDCQGRRDREKRLETLKKLDLLLNLTIILRQRKSMIKSRPAGRKSGRLPFTGIFTDCQWSWTKFYRHCQA